MIARAGAGALRMVQQVAGAGQGSSLSALSGFFCSLLLIIGYAK